MGFCLHNKICLLPFGNIITDCHPTDPGQPIKRSLGSVTPMKSKQPLQNTQGTSKPGSSSVADLSGHLADIELKLDHIIESIKDSLHRLNLKEKSDREESA